MTWKTHLIGGLQAGIIYATATGADPKTATIEIGAAAIGSLLPDIDHHNSKISRSDLLLTVISGQLSKITKHRREVHTVWASFLLACLTTLILYCASLTSATGTSFAAGLAAAIGIDLARGKIGSIVGILIFCFGSQYMPTESLTISQELIMPCAVAVFWGCISHLIYDSANIQGIMWLHPFSKKRYRFLNIQTQSKEEVLFAFAMGILLIALTTTLNPLGTQYIYEIYKSLK